MTVATPRIAYVDTATGEKLSDCPVCVQYEKDLRILKAKITSLEKDEEMEALEHPKWDEALTLHNWWGLATGHEGVHFGAKELRQALPRLKERTAVEFLQGVAGIAFDPNVKPRKNGEGSERYDSWELLTASGEKFKRYFERAPYWPSQPHRWKHWLIERIESRFR